jgi:hypothetical protein
LQDNINKIRIGANLSIQFRKVSNLSIIILVLCSNTSNRSHRQEKRPKALIVQIAITCKLGVKASNNYNKISFRRHSRISIVPISSIILSLKIKSRNCNKILLVFQPLSADQSQSLPTIATSCIYHKFVPNKTRMI